MDLDAILARRPQIVLVDELAHTNAPGCRHPKRYLDIEELLGAGIDVYTTVNIQHIESLNDVVAQITRIRVRETVPDTIFDRADAIELVDLTPDDLIQRLREGKVYLPKTARRALEHYFSPGNLTALRELAMRRTAERVDEQIAEPHARPCDPRAMGGGPAALGVHQRRPARGGAGALHPAHGRSSPRPLDSSLCGDGPQPAAHRGGARPDRRYASPGAQPRGRGDHDPGGHRRLADDVIAFAQANNVTQIIVGKSRRTRWFELLHGSVVHDLIQRSGNIGIHVVAGEDAAGEPIPRKTVTTARPLSFDPRAYGLSLLAVAGAVVAGELLWPWIGSPNIDLVFLTAIVGIAVRFGLWPSLMSSAVSALCYNFFFTAPYHQFAIADPANVVAVVFFTIVAIVVSNVAAHARIQAVAAMARARTTDQLYAFSRRLAGTGMLDEVLFATSHQLASMLEARVVLLLPEHDAIAVKTAYPPQYKLDDSDLAAATWAWRNNRTAGRGSATLPGAKRLFLPMRTGRGTIGVVGLDSDSPGRCSPPTSAACWMR